MTAISFSEHFIRKQKKLARKKPEITPVLLERFLLFNNDKNYSSLKLHKLTGNLKDHWAFSIQPDLRIIFRYTEDLNILVIDIGSHDDVY